MDESPTAKKRLDEIVRGGDDIASVQLAERRDHQIVTQVRQQGARPLLAGHLKRDLGCLWSARSALLSALDLAFGIRARCGCLGQLSIALRALLTGGGHRQILSKSAANDEEIMGSILSSAFWWKGFACAPR